MQPHGSEPPRTDANSPFPLSGMSQVALPVFMGCAGIQKQQCHKLGVCQVRLKLGSWSESYGGRRGKWTQWKSS